MVIILSTMYTKVQNCVRLFSNTSYFWDNSNGVKEGEPLSPILFIYFHNHMQEEMSIHINAMRILNLYADVCRQFRNGIIETA